VISERHDLRVLVASQPIDFRCGINRLVSLVTQALGADAYGGDLFVFRSRRRDRLKMIHFDGSGMVLTTKWLEDHRFFWPPVDGGVVTLSGAQYAALLSGLDWTKLEVKAVRRPTLSG